MPEKAHIVTLVAVAVAVGLGGYLVGTRSGDAKVAPEVTIDSKATQVEQEAITAQIDSQILVTNGIGTGVGEGDEVEEKRRQFLEASEKRTERLTGKVAVAADLDRDGAIAEDTSLGDMELIEVTQRLEALEQAFATDSRRNRARGVAGGDDIEEVREAITNLYDIVGSLPSIDTLETKIAAVDGAVEEMHATMEKLVEIGKKLEGHEGTQQSGAIENMQADLNRGLEVGLKTSESVAQIQEELTKNSADDKRREEMLGGLSKNIQDLTGRMSGVETKITSLERAVEGERGKVSALTSQISTMDRNLRTAIDGYRKIYENSARVEKRFVGIEAFLGDIEARMGAVEANFRPSSQQ